MDVLTEELRRALYADYGVAEVVEVEISAAQTLPAHELERKCWPEPSWTSKVSRLRLAIVPHPLNPLPDDQIRAAANAAVGEIVGSLTDGGTGAR